MKKISKEIKFRVWDKINKKFLNADSVAIRGNGIVVMVMRYGYGVACILDAKTKDNYIFQPFTGLYDKEDTEIYVGDMIYANHQENNGCMSLNYINHI